MNNQFLSVAIITKNRPFDLSECLTSLRTQTRAPEEIIIIDGSDTPETEQLVSGYRRYFQSLVYIREMRSGFPIARNRALDATRSTWIAFTDDDCVTDSRWVESLTVSIQNHADASAVAGLSKTYYPDNIYACATEINELLWKTAARRGTEIIDLETLDNKNIVYNRLFLKKNHIRYDESRSPYYYGASDDCDLGMQIQTHEGKGYYQPHAIVYHKDPTTLGRLIKGKFIRTCAHKSYERKWQQYRKGIRLAAIRRLPFIARYVRKKHISLYKTVAIISSLFLLFLTRRVAKSLVRVP